MLPCEVTSDHIGRIELASAALVVFPHREGLHCESGGYGIHVRHEGAGLPPEVESAVEARVVAVDLKCAEGIRLFTCGASVQFQRSGRGGVNAGAKQLRINIGAYETGASSRKSRATRSIPAAIAAAHSGLSSTGIKPSRK